MTFQASIRTCLRKYAEFADTASRSEFWWFASCFCLLIILLGMIGRELSPESIFFFSFVAESGEETLGIYFALHVFQWIAFLLLIVPLHAAAWRRCNDVGLNGIYSLLPWAGLITFIALAYVAAQLDRGFPTAILFLTSLAPIAVLILILASKGSRNSVLPSYSHRKIQ